MGHGYDFFCNPKHAGILSYIVLCHKGCKTIKKEHTPRETFLFTPCLNETNTRYSKSRQVFSFPFFLEFCGALFKRGFHSYSKSCAIVKLLLKLQPFVILFILKPSGPKEMCKSFFKILGGLVSPY